MKISDVKNKYNVSVRTLRYYEELGIIKPIRLKSNVRDFDESELEKLELILILKELNIKLKDIKDIIISDGSASLVGTLKDELTRLDADIIKIRNKRQLISSLLEIYGSSDITKHNIKEFMKQQIYVSSTNERISYMVINKDNIVLEIGKGLIATAIREENSLIDEVKKLRAKLNNEDITFVDKIRIKDNVEELKSLEYRILDKGNVIFQKSITNNDIKVQIQDIIYSLEKTLREII